MATPPSPGPSPAGFGRGRRFGGGGRGGSSGASGGKKSLFLTTSNSYVIWSGGRMAGTSQSPTPRNACSTIEIAIGTVARGTVPEV